MSLDNRLREGLGQIAADVPPQPLDVGTDLQGVLVAGRRRRVMRRAYVGFAVAGVAFIALLAGSSVVRQLGIEKVKTADNPPAETKLERDNDPGVDQPGETGGLAPRGGGTGADANQPSSRVDAPKQAPAAGGGSSVTPTPNKAGTYFYSVSGWACGGLYGCGDMKELNATFRQPNGSHQEVTHKWINKDGGRLEDEDSYDYRPDGVYLEHYHGTLYNPQGAVVSAWACPELRAFPVRVWPTGAKPGDHFEYTVQCEGGSTHNSVDILRAETVSVGGRDVETLLAQIKGQSPDSPQRRRTTEAWIFPANYFRIKEHAEWTEDFGGGRYQMILESMTPR